MMMPRKKKRMLIISSIVICIVAIIAILVVLYINTDMFKSKETLFKKYIGQNFENMDELYKSISKSEYDETLKGNKYTSETDLKLNYVENIGTTLESLENPINQLRIKISGQTDKENNYNYQDIILLREKEPISEVKYIQTEDLIGIEFSDLFSQYVLAKNENLKTLLGQAELSEEQLEKIPDKINLNANLEDLLTFSEEEKESITQKYTNIIVRNISNGKFSKLNNQTIQINGKNISANGYSLALTKEKLNDLYLALLEELKQDEVILSKLDKIQEVLDQYKMIYGEMKNVKNKFVAEIQYLMDHIVKNNIGQEECKIVVYEKNGTTVKTVIQGIGYEMNMDLLVKEEYIKISYQNTEKEEKIEKSLLIQKETEQKKIHYQLVEGEKIVNYSIVIEEGATENNDTRNINAKYEDDTNRVELNIQEKAQTTKELEEITWNHENSVNLSELQSEQVKAIVNRIHTSISEKINEIQENVIDIEDIDEILIATKLIKQGQEIAIEGITETEKNRFNSKFEILQGEDLDQEAVLNIISAIQDNLIELQPISDTEISLKIDRFNKNEEAVTTIKNFIQNMKNKNYEAKIEYNEETGLVDKILLKMIEEKK